jgi:hypothetical protein
MSTLGRRLRDLLFRVTGGARRETLLTRQLLVQAAAAAEQIRARERVETLADVELSVFSQWGEDGILDWLVHHLGDVPETFVEFGVEDYREANTRFLLSTRGWRGFVMDADAGHVESIRRDALSWRHDLDARQAFVTRDNIDALLDAAGIPGDIGVLSLDIDGNDYWVWDAITRVRPHIVVVEYNAVLGDRHPLTIPYDAAFRRDRAHESMLYWGASIGALRQLAGRKGYLLAGSNRAGCNAFFLREDRADRILSRIADIRPRPSRFREARDSSGTLTFTRGRARAAAIAAMPVFNTSDGTTKPLSAYGELYSEEWSTAIDGGRTAVRHEHTKARSGC